MYWKVRLVYDPKCPSMQLEYYFEKEQDAYTSFVTTYSGCGGVAFGRVTGNSQNVYNKGNLVGTIWTVDLQSIILSQPTHF